MNPPSAVEVTIPSNHRTSRTIATVVSIETSRRTWLRLELLAAGGLAGGDRHHDARANDDEIADDKEMNESHVDGTTIGAAARCVCPVVHTREVCTVCISEQTRLRAMATMSAHDVAAIGPASSSRSRSSSFHQSGALLDSLSDRHIVQVFNKDESHIYATILAIPNYRLRATDKTVMTFAERAEGDPQAIRAWFYPGDNWATPSWSTTDSSADGPRGLSVRPSLMKPIDPDQLARLLSDGA